MLRPLALALAVAACLLLLACTDTTAGRGGGDEIVIADSPPVGSVSETTTALAGRAFDYLSGDRLTGALVSTFPPTETLRTNADGEFVVVDGLVPGEIYELKGELDGYLRALVPAQAIDGRRATVNLPLLPRDKAVPVRFDPPMLVFTADRQEAQVQVTSEATVELDLTWSLPPWLAVAGEPIPLPPHGRETLTFRLVPEAYAEAVAALEAGDALRGQAEVRDAFDRLQLLQALAVPPTPSLVSLTVSGAPAAAVPVGAEVELEAQVRYGARPMVGAALRVASGGEALTVAATEAVTDDRGRLVFEIEAARPGRATLTVDLPSVPEVAGQTLEIEVAAAPCLADATGRNACGEARFWACEADAAGQAVCTDLDECRPDEAGFNTCGEAAHWECLNREGAPAVCVDREGCADPDNPNGGCGDPSLVRCEEREGRPSACRPIDLCATNNGGCGDPREASCVNGLGRKPDCEPVDACAPDASGQNACGSAAFWRCTDAPGAPVSCEDKDECADPETPNGGCGDPATNRCLNLPGRPPECVAFDPCAAGPDGRNACGPVEYWDCRGMPEGGSPACDDVDECADPATPNGGCGAPALVTCLNRAGAAPECLPVGRCGADNGGCGDPAQWRCLDQGGPSPTCERRDPCAVDGEGDNACGEARFWRCTNEPGLGPRCDDVAECAAENGGCGDPAHFLCLEQRGAPPRCEDRDACAVDAGGRNACGEALRWRCTDRVGQPPLCEDVDECADDPCGPFARCRNLPGAAPACDDLDDCQPGPDGRNACGEPDRWRCTNRDGAPAACEDLDECAPDAAGFNACGDPVYWGCRNRLGEPPLCEDLDECAVDADGRNACGDASQWRCTNREGAAPLCEDPCAPDAAGLNDCGVAAHWLCLPRAGQDPLCLDRDACAPDAAGRNTCGAVERWICVDAEGAAPDCVDVDECALDNGACGEARFVRCVDRVGEAPLCVDVDECALSNGGCGPVQFNVCTNRLALPPTCTPRDLCAADAQGLNHCGEARFWLCDGAPGELPTCTDRPECAVADGENACGRARASLCRERIGAAPECEACPEGRHNLDLDDTDCEYTCLPDGEETCDGADEDCDGEVDEVFDLRSDPANCGACGQSCEALDQVAGAFCNLGRCAIQQCADGFYDGDGLAENGCEVPFPADTVYIDGPRGDPAPDGTAAHPYLTITQALGARAGRGPTTFAVAPGVYTEAVNVAVAGVRVIGAGASLVTVTGCGDTCVTLSASRTTLAGLTVSGARRGVLLSAVSDTQLFGLRVTDALQDSASVATPGPAAVGIQIDGGTRHTLRNVDITGVTALRRAGPAYGLYVGGAASDVLVEGLSVARLRASPGSDFGVYGAPNGGAAVGVSLNGGTRYTLRDVRVEDLLGGGANPVNGINALAGGYSAGLYARSGADTVTVQRFAARGLSGNNGGTSANRPGGRGGAAYGLLFQNTRQLDVREVDLRDLRAGNGAAGTTFGQAGIAMGVGVQDTVNGAVRNVAVWNVRPGDTPTNPAGADGLNFGGVSGLVFEHLTIARIGLPGGTLSSGVSSALGQRIPIEVRNVVVSGVEGVAVRNLDATNPVHLAYALLHGAGDPYNVGGPLVTTGSILTDDPRFRRPEVGDLHLLPGSPAIDAADPDAPFGQEPDPNGGRADLGAYGNTAEATPSAD